MILLWLYLAVYLLVASNKSKEIIKCVDWKIEAWLFLAIAMF